MKAADQKPDIQAPSLQRQSELETIYEARKENDAPYRGVRIGTLGELLWIMDQRHWSIQYWPAGVPGNLKMTRPQFQEAIFQLNEMEGGNFRGVPLRNADLQGASLQMANFQGAELYHANLKRASLKGASLEDANLRHAHLEHADLQFAQLEGASLQYAHLEGADLRSAHVKGIRLWGSYLQETHLEGVDLTGIDFTECTGKPIWPDLSKNEQTTVQQEAAHGATSSDRLMELATTWPGCVVRATIASNPNTPAKILRWLAKDFPAETLANPILPHLFATDPRWLKWLDALRFEEAIQAHPDSHELETRYPNLMESIQAIARKG
jgi:Pentapeptide repeats (8 copies)